MSSWFKDIGPGTLVAAAFIGPGTVTMCTLAGVQSGYALLWAMVLSIGATIVLQEAAARTSLITGKNLATVITTHLHRPIVKNIIVIIIFSGILIGNTAYEAGNISGAVLGMNAVLGNNIAAYYPLIIGIIAFLLLNSGSYKVIEKVLIALVLIMSTAFMITAILTQPDLTELFKGLLIPKMARDEILIVIGLIGTTVVPYNLFLHSSLVNEKWSDQKDLKKVRKDLFVSVSLGGLVSLAIIISAGSIQGQSITSGADLGAGLASFLGDKAKYLVGIGLFAAGITSAITAPLAASYVAESLFGWDKNLGGIKFKSIWAGILVIGVLFSSIGFKPIEIIKFAQIANGLLLPCMAILLFWIVNQSNVLSTYKNNMTQNLILGFIILITILLGAKGMLTLL